MTEKNKKKFKLPHLFFIMIGLIVIMSCLTYIIPAGKFYKDADGNIDTSNFQYLETQQPVSLIKSMFMFMKGLVNSGLVVWVVMISGANMAVILETKSIDNFLNWATYKLEKQSIKVLIPVLYFLILYIAGFAGTDALIAVVPIGVIFAKKLKLDPISGLAATFFPSMIGFGMGPTLKVLIPQTMLGVESFSGFGLRFIMMNLFGIIGLMFTMSYVRKIEKDPNNSILGTDWLQEINSDEQFAKIELPVRSVIVLILTILQYIALVVYSLTVGTNIYEFLIGFFIVTSIIIGFIGGLSADQLGNSFAKGLGAMAFVTFVIGLASTMQMIMVEGKILDTIVYFITKPLMNLNRGMSVIGITSVITILNPIVPSATAKAAVLMPILEPIAKTLGITSQVAVQAFLFGDAFTNMISPALGWTMGALTIAKVSYDKWFKWVIKPVIALILLSFISVFLLDLISWTGM